MKAVMDRFIKTAEAAYLVGIHDGAAMCNTPDATLKKLSGKVNY